jgi:predicted transcriptional regulator
MKTAVSIPDDLFRRADELASQLGKSRSELYREALADYVARRDPKAVTSNQLLAAAPGSVALTAPTTGLPKDSVANVSQIVAIDRELLTERVGRLSAADLGRIIVGIDLVLGRD